MRCEILCSELHSTVGTPRALRWSMKQRAPKKCHDCDVPPGRFHQFGCDVETCALCGEQLITCPCVYTLSGLDPERLHEDHPDVYCRGPNATMRARYAREVAKYGGRVPWSGDSTGSDLCAELGWYVRPVGSSFVRCKPDAPGAVPDVERLSERARWDPALRRYVVRLRLVR